MKIAILLQLHKTYFEFQFLLKFNVTKDQNITLNKQNFIAAQQHTYSIYFNILTQSV